MNYALNTYYKKSNLISFSFLLTLSLVFSNIIYAQNDKAGVFSFETEEIDFGTINQNDNGVKVFKFTNTGKTPLVITDVKTSCGCTVPTYSKKPILSGETGEIEIKYDTNRIGVFTKTITIVSNANEPSKILKIKGEVLPKSN
jgi:hypothetical protein